MENPLIFEDFTIGAPDFTIGIPEWEDGIPDAEEEEEDESPRAQRKLDKLNLDEDDDYL